MSFLAAAASDEGGITGFLLDLVEKLGPVGVGLSILAETVIPPIPIQQNIPVWSKSFPSGRLPLTLLLDIVVGVLSRDAEAFGHLR